MEALEVSTELKKQIENLPKQSMPRILTDEDVERMEKAEKQRKHDDVVNAIWKTTGVRARQAGFPVASTCEPWNKLLHQLRKRIGSGFLAALIGNRGTGKSQLAVECIRFTVGKEKTAVYTTAMDIFIDLRDTFKLQESERSVLLRFQRPALLVIDEAQERGETAWEDRMLTALIDYRYSQKRDTILISNLKRDEFEKSMGASVISRMVEVGGIIECSWPSFRIRTT
jgi:hypothetical protein